MKKSNILRVKENGFLGEFLGVYMYRLKSLDIRIKFVIDVRIMVIMKRFWLDVVGIKFDMVLMLDVFFDGFFLLM